MSAAEAFQLDLNDPHILEMADRNHVPTEEWRESGYVTVKCARCKQAWPCLTRRQLRGREAKNT